MAVAVESSVFDREQNPKDEGRITGPRDSDAVSLFPVAGETFFHRNKYVKEAQVDWKSARNSAGEANSLVTISAHRKRGGLSFVEGNEF